MQNFYITTSLVRSKIFIAPIKIDANKTPWLIECETRWHADNLLKELNYKKKLSPSQDKDSYKLVESISIKNLGTTEIFQLL